VSTVARNILANAAGTGLAFAVLLVSIPLYLRLLGPEPFGLVGLFATMMAAATAIDLGLGATLNREVARMTSGHVEPDEFADVPATLQASSWVVGLVAAGTFGALAPAIAARWLNLSALSPAEVRGALTLMAAALPAVVARSVHLAGLNGLQRQPLANLMQATGSVTRAALTVTALIVIAPSLTVFFATQTLVLYAEALALRAALRRALPATAHNGRIRPGAVRHLVGFSGGMAGTMLLGFALTSMDQVVLSAILPLAEFGYYTLAVAVSGALGQIVHPVTTAVYPRFSQLIEESDPLRVAEEYHFFSQLVAVVVLPLGALLIFFPDHVLGLWTRDAEVVRHGATVLSLRAIGTTLNTLMYVPHVVQLAFGWSTLGVGVNAVAVVFVVPLTILLSLVVGAPGAALAWIGLNLGALLLAMARMHHRVLPGELGGWYARLLPPALAVTVIAALARAAMPDGLSAPIHLAWLLITVAVAAAAALTAAPTVRRRLIATGGRSA
jgi:O-antigen/teichoic acid export membrane protein